MDSKPEMGDGGTYGVFCLGHIRWDFRAGYIFGAAFHE